jgi:hypothetical protein
MNYQKLTELQAKFYSAQIVMALDYLHGVLNQISSFVKQFQKA